MHDAYICLGRPTGVFWYAAFAHLVQISLDTPTQILLWDPIWQLPYRVVCSCTSLCEGELRNITKQLLECCEGFVTRPKDPWERRHHHHSRLSILTTEGCPLSKHSIVKFAIGNAMWVVVWKIWGKKLKKKKKRKHWECFQLSQAYIFFSRLTPPQVEGEYGDFSH